MVNAEKFICFHCKHLHAGRKGCDAFPDGIPYGIAELGQRHDKPLKGQKNKIVYERGIPESAKGTFLEARYKKLFEAAK